MSVSRKLLLASPPAQFMAVPRRSNRLTGSHSRVDQRVVLTRSFCDEVGDYADEELEKEDLHVFRTRLMALEQSGNLCLQSPDAAHPDSLGPSTSHCPTIDPSKPSSSQQSPKPLPRSAATPPNSSTKPSPPGSKKPTSTGGPVNKVPSDPKPSMGNSTQGNSTYNTTKPNSSSSNSPPSSNKDRNTSSSNSSQMPTAGSPGSSNGSSSSMRPGLHGPGNEGAHPSAPGHHTSKSWNGRGPNKQQRQWQPPHGALGDHAWQQQQQGQGHAQQYTPQNLPHNQQPARQKQTRGARRNGGNGSSSSSKGLSEKRVVLSPGPASWAHIRGQPEPGCLLLARGGGMDMGFFNRTVILITSHDSSTGSEGLVLNMTSPMRVDEIQLAAACPPWFNQTFGSHKLHIGGHLHLDQATVLHGYMGLSGARQVSDGLYTGGLPDAVQLVQAGLAKADEFSLILGSSAWAPGQLGSEINRGMWHCVSASFLASCTSRPAGITALPGRESKDFAAGMPYPFCYAFDEVCLSKENWEVPAQLVALIEKAQHRRF